MNKKEPLPSVEGLKKYIKRFRDLRQKKPSDDLVRIIQEVTEENYPDRESEKDRAAAGINPTRPDLEA